MSHTTWPVSCVMCHKSHFKCHILFWCGSLLVEGLLKTELSSFIKKEILGPKRQRPMAQPSSGAFGTTSFSVVNPRHPTSPTNPTLNYPTPPYFGRAYTWSAVSTHLYYSTALVDHGRHVASCPFIEMMTENINRLRQDHGPSIKKAMVNIPHMLDMGDFKFQNIECNLKVHF